MRYLYFYRAWLTLRFALAPCTTRGGTSNSTIYLEKYKGVNTL